LRLHPGGEFTGVMEDYERPPVPGGGMRVSDQDRDSALELLGQHTAAGRLTLDELEERAGQMLAARTRDELAALTRDLPATPPVPATRRKPVRWMVTVMSGSHRRGRFRAAGSVNVVSILGEEEIDLREAEIDGGELVLNVFTVMGGAIIYVPDTIDVEVEGVSIIGGNTEHGARRPPRPGAPLVRIRTYNLLGGSTIFRLPPQARGLPLRKARKMATAAARGKLPAPH
jgi:Domain of unknown function (DUF1707)/Cell wall-active antibiotics response 4TMS YvqF